MTTSTATRAAILAAVGTSREIAARLDVSQRTVARILAAAPPVKRCVGRPRAAETLYQSQKRRDRRARRVLNRTNSDNPNTIIGSGDILHTIHRADALSTDLISDNLPRCDRCGRPVVSHVHRSDGPYPPSCDGARC